ncbi:MAG: LPS biosynthesis glycosyltransferase [Gloeocapsa sp. DLM2.Bin57]|nr:MAG: LPS biosynthesis glycosyltransferase [Gloeocapsa sp. DLM2.Bin57]
MAKLRETIGRVLIIAYKENTDNLETTLTQEGLPYQLLRQQHLPEYQNYSPSYLCLLNHYRAWEIASQQTDLTLILEADFVPVEGFAQLPLPFSLDQQNVGIAWLYTCAPQVYSISPQGYAEGYSASTVAYIVTPDAAQLLLNLPTSYQPDSYSSWDSHLDQYLRGHNLINYLPFRNYGEHGGKPNLEHQKVGLSKTHRADVIYGKLAFNPFYAETGSSQFFGVRLQGRLKGLTRLVTGRFIRYKIIFNSRNPWRLIRFAITRQLSLRI